MIKFYLYRSKILIILTFILDILLLFFYFTLEPYIFYKKKHITTPHTFLTLSRNPLKTDCLLNSGVSFCTDDGKSDGDITFYIPLYEGDNLIFVPVVSVDNINFEPDLTKPIYKGNPIPNNEKDSKKAIEKAIVIFKKSELCVCDLKQIT